jgi:ribose 5-phosphate isomerase
MRAQSFLRDQNVSDDTDQNKKRAAEAALRHLPEGAIVGIGTGSTVNFFIDALARRGTRVKAAVSSSEATSSRLRAAGIDVIDLNDAGTLEIYIDGADEATRRRELIKGGGGALPEPGRLERELNQIAGIVTVGLFAERRADLLLVGTAHGVDTI